MPTDTSVMRRFILMDIALVKALVALAPTCLLPCGSLILLVKTRTVALILQVLGAICLVVVALAHAAERCGGFRRRDGVKRTALGITSTSRVQSSVSRCSPLGTSFRHSAHSAVLVRLPLRGAGFDWTRPADVREADSGAEEAGAGVSHGGVSTGRSIRAPHAPHAIHTRSSSVPPLRSPHNRCSRKKASKSSSSRSLIAWQLTSAPLGDPRSNEAEKYTSNDDGDGESDETEPEPLKVRHHKSRFGVNDA
jgi:hypothetical protein